MNSEASNRNNLEKTTIGDICTVVRGGSPRPMGSPKYFSGHIPFIKISDITKEPSRYIYDSVTHVNKEGAKKSRLLPKNSLILSNSGTVSVPKFLGVDACIHDGFVSFENFTKETSLDYLFHYFNYIRPIIRQKHKQGITQVNLNTKIVGEIEIPLPPLPEQHRIVQKIEELLSELDAGVASLKKAKEQLKTYRQAVLKAAFEGKLTGNEVKFHIVESGKIIETINNGYTPKAGKMDTYGEIPFIKVYNLTFDGSLDFSYRPTFISKETHEKELKRSRIYPGDVLINIVGPPLGKVSVVPNTYEEWNTNQAVVLFRPNENILSKYLSYLLQSPQIIKWLTATSRATAGQFNVKVSTCRMIPFEVCSLEEQNLVIREIETRLSVCDHLKQTIEQELQQSESLRQSILKRAFEGRLVS